MADKNDGNEKVKNSKQYIVFDLEATCWEEKNDKLDQIMI